jgi:sulfane dehydrogenase subunit SoxC
MVDRPLTFTVDDLKRLPSVTRLHFIGVRGKSSVACGEDRSREPRHDELRRMDRRAPLAAPQRVRPKGGAKWFVAEGSEEVKGASSMPIAKAMDDCFVAYAMNGEPLRPPAGISDASDGPGFEGIFHTKYLRRIKVVDRYYMNYNDFGHMDQDPKIAALEYQIGPKSVITSPSGGTTAAGKGFLRDQRAGMVRRRRHQTGGSVHQRRQDVEQGRVQGTPQRMAHTRFGLSWNLGRNGNGDHVALRGRDRSGSTNARTAREVLEQALRCHVLGAGTRQQRAAVANRQRRERDQWQRVGSSRSPCR